MIKDSGERTQFYDQNGKEIGVRDLHTGKGRAEYIEREKAMDAVRKADFYSGQGKMSLDNAVNALRYVPAADVVPGSDFRDCRNELCLRCGDYTRRHLGACDGCRWRDA